MRLSFFGKYPFPALPSFLVDHEYARVTVRLCARVCRRRDSGERTELRDCVGLVEIAGRHEIAPAAPRTRVELTDMGGETLEPRPTFGREAGRLAKDPAKMAIAEAGRSDCVGDLARTGRNPAAFHERHDPAIGQQVRRSADEESLEGRQLGCRSIRALNALAQPFCIR